jgi:hypothetical protein
MNWDAIGAVGETVGALGVLVTLVYLATQIRDNTRSLQAASLQSVLEGARDRYFLPMAQSSDMSEIFARGLTCLDDLDADEKRRFFYMMFEQYFQMQQVMHLHERDLIPQVDYDAWLDYTTSLTRTPGGAEMWTHCETVITPTIAKVINAHLREAPDLPSFIQLVPLFERKRRGNGAAQE